MLEVLIYIILFSLLYLAYRWVKQKFYTYKDLGPLDESREQYLFLTCLYVFIFIISMRFTVVSPSGIGVYYRGSETYMIPFSEIIEANRFNVFYEFVSGNESTGISQLIKDYLLRFAQSMIILLPLSLSLFAAYKCHLKRFIWLLVTVMVSYYFSGELFIGSTIIKVVILYGLTYLIHALVEKLFRRRSTIIWLFIFILLAGVVFTSDIHIVSDSYVTSYKAPESMEFDEPYVSNGDVALTFDSAKLREDHSEIELEYTLKQLPKLDIPYEYNFLNLTLDLQTGEKLYKYGFMANDQKQIASVGRTNSLRINNIDISDSHRSKSIFPLTIYGISEILYVITDSSLLKQISFEDSGWLSDEPYTCFRLTYRVPKTQGYELRWSVSVKYNDLWDQTYNPHYSYYTKKMILEETESSILYEVKNYFYDREASDIKILGPEVTNVIYGLEFEIDTTNPILHFESADDM